MTKYVYSKIVCIVCGWRGKRRIHANGEIGGGTCPRCHVANGIGAIVVDVGAAIISRVSGQALDDLRAQHDRENEAALREIVAKLHELGFGKRR